MPHDAGKDPALAVVTGANRGLGRETCRQLAALGLRVLLTARELRVAQATAAGLSGKGLPVEAAQLDVTDEASVRALADSLRPGAGRIAALVNNAGVSLDGFDARVARGTLAVNYHGAARVTGALAPLLAPGACVVMVSSGMGEVSCLGAPLRERFLRDDLTRPALDALLEAFVTAVERGDYRAQGWPRSAYSVSKVGLNALTRILAREFSAAGKAGAPRINAVCPGWVRTDMGGRFATRGVEKGARSIVWAATLPPDGPTGGFFRDGNPIPW